MAKRGDVLVVRRRIGFAGEGRRERWLVVLHDRLCASRRFVVAAPLDLETAVHAGDPLAVPMPAAEAGSRKDQVVEVMQVQSLPVTGFEPGRSGQASAATMRRVEIALRYMLALP